MIVRVVDRDRHLVNTRVVSFVAVRRYDTIHRGEIVNPRKFMRQSRLFVTNMITWCPSVDIERALFVLLRIEARYNRDLYGVQVRRSARVNSTRRSFHPPRSNAMLTIFVDVLKRRHIYQKRESTRYTVGKFVLNLTHFMCPNDSLKFLCQFNTR